MDEPFFKRLSKQLYLLRCRERKRELVLQGGPRITQEMQGPTICSREIDVHLESPNTLLWQACQVNHPEADDIASTNKLVHSRHRPHGQVMQGMRKVGPRNPKRHCQCLGRERWPGIALGKPQSQDHQIEEICLVPQSNGCCIAAVQIK